MRKLLSALLYTALLGVANLGTAQSADIADLREGEMRKLVFHPAPVATTEEAFTSEDGTEMTLADLEGRYVVLNFWATWCAPCRVEMPHLSALQSDLGGDDFAVVTVAVGPNPQPAMERFFQEIGVDNLPLHIDPRQRFARAMGVLGLPVTVILDPDGMEIARMQGEADWSSPSAVAILTALLDDPA
ncbi:MULTISPECIES: TlpA disulfide reductase family protein [unclassified Yoonia]|uniref:TlpA disulfide reductase family protein n=1 Tax=unclassified Yoonia TaxID=2629118 RepID=UPI002AFEC7E0|nr:MULTISPECIES: TlpA disulfide reductase family protein [unclassified Yoonia]